MNGLPACGNCKKTLPAAVLNSNNFTACDCGAKTRAWVFPAAVKLRETERSSKALDGDSVCFYHDAARAVAICDGCGRLVCQLCRIESSGAHVCPTCFEQGFQRGDVPEAKARLRYHDGIVLSLASSSLVALLIFFLPLSPALAISAIVYAFWNRGKTASSIPRMAWRSPVGVIIAMVSLILYGVLASFILGALFANGPFNL